MSEMRFRWKSKSFKMIINIYECYIQRYQRRIEKIGVNKLLKHLLIFGLIRI